MLRSPRLWLGVAGGWLAFAGLGHLGYHVWGVVLENDFAGGLREFGMQAMKQAQSPDPLRPSMWRVYRVYSVSLAFLFLLGGLVDFTAARSAVPHSVKSSLALLQTIFWTAAFVPFALVDPVIQPLMVVAMAVPLHGIAYITAEAAAREGSLEAG